MTKITEDNWNKILYCPNCGSTDISLELWWDQETGEIETPTEKAWNSEGFCNICGAPVTLMTLPELWDKWKDLLPSITRYTDTRIELAVESFLGFSEGTSMCDVMDWFAARCPHSIYEDLEPNRK